MPPPKAKIEGDVITLPEGYEPPEGLDMGPSDLDYVKAQAGRDATAARDTAAQVVGGAATKHEDFETVKDAATMVPAGATMDWDDELMGHLGAIGEALGNPMQDPRVAAQKGYRMARDAQRGRKAIASTRSPWAAGAGYGVGTLAQQAVAGPLLRGATGLAGKAAQYATGTAEAAEGAGVGARIATGAGNAAVPAALTGAGQADSMEDVPLNAAVGGGLGLITSGAVHAPGALRKIVASPRYVGRPAEEFADDAFLRAAGLNKGQIKKVADKPGGKKAYIKRMRDLDIGNDWIPTNQRIEEQATDVANKLQAQNEALVAPATDVRIPMEDVAQEVEKRAADKALFGHKELRAELAGEAHDFRTLGKPESQSYVYHSAPESTVSQIQATGLTPMGETPEIYFTNTPESAGDWNRRTSLKGEQPAVMLRTAQSPDIQPHADVPEFAVSTKPVPTDKLEYWDAEKGAWRPLAEHTPHPEAQEAGGGWVYKPNENAFKEPAHDRTFADLVRDRQGYHEGAFTSETALRQQSKREVGAAINDILEKYANKLPGEIGTPWREGNRKLNTALDAMKYARAGQGGGNLGKGLKIGGAITAAVSGNPSVLAGLVGTVPGVQMRMAQGIGAISRAAARPPGTLERVLQKITPSGSNAGRYLAHRQAQESITAVQQAALQGDEEAHSEHYRRMLTDPAYNRFALSEEE